MSMSIEVNDRAAQAALRRMIEAGEDLSQPLQEAGDAIVETSRLSFTDQASPYGESWAPHAPLTVALRRGGGGQLLRDTGGLMNSIAATVAADTVEVGTNKIYGAVHQFGATIRPKNFKFLFVPLPGGGVIALSKAVIPARPYLPIRDGEFDPPDDLRDEILDIFGMHVLPEGSA